MKVLITTVPFASVDRKPLDSLEAAGLLYTINPIGRRLTEVELIELIGDTSILIAGTEPITARAMDSAPQLRMIARIGIGLDNVDLDAARERRIAVTYTPEAPAPAVAELTIGFMIDLLRGVSRADRLMHAQKWHRFLGRRLDGLTVGVIGVGRIGKRVIRILRSAFPNVTILANDVRQDRAFGLEQHIRWAEKDEIYSVADIITLHLPLTQHTRRLIAERELSSMKSTSVIINTSRGEIVDEAALASALSSGRVAGAAVDVFEHEPYAGPLTKIEKCILTCHMGSMAEDCRSAMELEAIEDVLRFTRGEPLKQPVPESEYLEMRR